MGKSDDWKAKYGVMPPYVAVNAAGLIQDAARRLTDVERSEPKGGVAPPPAPFGYAPLGLPWRSTGKAHKAFKP